MINFPNNVKKFEGIVEIPLLIKNNDYNDEGPFTIKLDREKEFKIKIKYLLAYQELIEHIINKANTENISKDFKYDLLDLQLSTTTLIDLFDTLKNNE